MLTPLEQILFGLLFAPLFVGAGVWLILLGLSASLNTLVVCHCYREAEEVIRIISARKANKAERTEYAQRWKP